MSTHSRPEVLLTGKELLRNAAFLDPAWLKAAFILLLVGYGTKMGLAPMHTWLPDAHSESPSLVSSLLSGALLNCAFLALWRSHAVCAQAGLGDFSGNLLMGFGLLSMAIAAVFTIGQNDFKRLLAYSSVEHMGILAFASGLGGAASAVLLHAVNHSLTKAMLFLTAGNILSASRSKSTQETRGLLRALPVSGALWLAGFFAITGTPPFGPFVSELWILQGALHDRRYVSAAIYLLLLAVIFIAMASIFLKMCQGQPSENLDSCPQETDLWKILPPIILGLLVLMLGLWIPRFLLEAFGAAASCLGAAS